MTAQTSPTPFMIPTRQKAPDLWPSLSVALQAAGAALSLPAAEVDGYQSVAFLIISDQPFTLTVMESLLANGEYITTASQGSSLDAASGLQKLALRVSPSGAFMKASVQNTGSSGQRIFQMRASGYPSSGSSSGGSSGGAPSTSAYVVVTADPSIPNARVIAQGSGITITDGGPGGALTISATGSGGAPTTATYVLLSADASLPNSRRLVQGAGITLTDAGAGGTLTISSSGSDATAWHNTGDSFGGTGGYVLGTLDANTLTLTANNVPLMKFGKETLPNIFLGNVLTIFDASVEPALQYRRSDAWANLVLACDQDGSGGVQGTGESLIGLLNDEGASLTMNMIGSNYGTMTFNNVISSSSQARYVCGGGVDNLVIGNYDGTPVWFVLSHPASATGPVGKLHLSGGGIHFSLFAPSTDTFIDLYDTGTTTNPISISGSGGNAFITTSAAADNLGFFVRTGTTSTTRFEVTNAGAFVLNTGGPLIALDQNGVGTIDANDFSIQTGGNKRLIIEAGGTVRPLNDNDIPLGKAGKRFSDIWAVTTHFGDVNMDDDKFDSHWTLREAKIKGEDRDSLYAINRRTKQKFKVVLQAA